MEKSLGQAAGGVPGKIPVDRGMTGDDGDGRFDLVSGRWSRGKTGMSLMGPHHRTGRVAGVSGTVWSVAGRWRFGGDGSDLGTVAAIVVGNMGPGQHGTGSGACGLMGM